MVSLKQFCYFFEWITRKYLEAVTVCLILSGLLTNMTKIGFKTWMINTQIIASCAAEYLVLIAQEKAELKSHMKGS